MADIVGMVRKAAEKTGFVRERFNEKDIPTDPSRITVVPFFGDLRSTFVLSSLLLKRFREEDKGSKYFILCSWPGFNYFFPYVDEYWGVQDQTVLKKLHAEALEFDNTSSLAAVYHRNLNNYFFEDVVVPAEVFKKYYHRGITDEFWTKYRHVKRTLPMVPSAAVLGRDFNRLMAEKGGYKVFIHPTFTVQGWITGKVSQINLAKEFWVSLCRSLITNHMVPVVWRSFMSYDLSPDLPEQCIHLNEPDIGKVLGAMRACSCALDVFNGLSRLAIAARTPYLSIADRQQYTSLKEFEIDDLCGKDLPREYIFSFPTILEGNSGSVWDYAVLDNMIARLKSFLPDLDRDTLPSTGELTDIVPYDSVRKTKAKKIGVRLLKVPRD
jgi:hypothetical protein